jgi:hypothetical protein
MSAMTAAPAREVVAAAIAAGHHRVADLIAATGLPRQTLSNELTMGKKRGDYVHDQQAGEWRLSKRAANGAPPGSRVAPSLPSTPPVSPRWLARWVALFDGDASALAPLIAITPELAQAAAVEDQAAARRAALADEIAATSEERQTLEAQHRALSRTGAGDTDLDAIDAALSRLSVRAGRRAAALPIAIRAHGAALLDLYSVLRDALVAASLRHKAELATTDALWQQLTQRVQSLRNANTHQGTLDQLAAAQLEWATLGQARQADVAALDVLDKAWWTLPIHVDQATSLATLPEAAVASWVTACEQLPAQRAEVVQLRQAAAGAGAGSGQSPPLRKAERRLAWIRGLPDQDGEG